MYFAIVIMYFVIMYFALVIMYFVIMHHVLILAELKEKIFELEVDLSAAKSTISGKDLTLQNLQDKYNRALESVTTLKQRLTDMSKKCGLPMKKRYISNQK